MVGEGVIMCAIMPEWTRKSQTRRRWRATFLINKFIIVKKKSKLIVLLLHVFLGILSPRIWHNDDREVNERMKEVLMMEWL